MAAGEEILDVAVGVDRLEVVAHARQRPPLGHARRRHVRGRPGRPRPRLLLRPIPDLADVMLQVPHVVVHQVADGDRAGSSMSAIADPSAASTLVFRMTCARWRL